MSDALQNDIRDRLEKDHGFKQSGKYMRGTCPTCNEKEKGWTWFESPMRIMCSRNSCDSIAARELYEDLFEEFSDRHPATVEDPDKTARHYLSDNRGFNLTNLNDKLWHQATRPTPCGKKASTVRFPFGTDMYWERIIDNSMAVLFKDGRKAHFKFGGGYKGKHWAPKKYSPTLNDRVYIVEGIFHSIALHEADKMAIAAFSCNNFPWDFVNKYKGMGVIWCLAFDNGEAGRENILKYREQLTALGETSEIHLCIDDKIDWDAALRTGDLKKEGFWDDCAYRGKLLGASKVLEYAYHEYCHRRYSHKIIVFRKKHYAISVFYKINKDLDTDSGEKIAIGSEQGKTIFTQHVKYERISNCHIEMLFRQHDIVFRDQLCVIRLSYSHKKQVETVEMKGGAFTALGKFRDKLADNSTATFSGKQEHLDSMYDDWQLHITDIDVQPYVGYNAQHKSYVFPKQGFVNNRLNKIGKENYYPLSKNQGIRTSLDSIPFDFGKDYDKDLGQKIYQIWGVPGLISLAGFTAAVFTDQLKRHYGDWPFIELYGEPGGGKSTLIRILWKMLGRMDDWEGIDVTKTRPAGRAALFAQMSNMPAVVIESDHADDKSFSWGEFKDYYGHRAVIRGRGTTDKFNTDNLQFLGTLFFVQNARIETDHTAVIERLVGAVLKRAKIENRPVAEELKSRPVKSFNGYMGHVISKEKAFIQQVINGENIYKKQLYKSEYPVRIIENHARILAAIAALRLFFNIEDAALTACADYMAVQLKERAERLGADHPDVAEYWESVEYMEAQAHSGGTSQREYDFDDIENGVNKSKQVNHSNIAEEFWIWPKEVEAFATKHGQKMKAFKDVRVLLTLGNNYIYLGHGKKHSPLRNKTVQLYRFKRPRNG